MGTIATSPPPTRPRRHPRSSVALLLCATLAAGIADCRAHAHDAGANPYAGAQTWFAPNMGSADYLELFAKPEAWSATRSKIEVFEFYTQNLQDQPCAICGPNTLRAFVAADAFRKLEKWGVAVAVEVPAVKAWGCGAKEADVVSHVIKNVEQSGGKVQYLAMDEPLNGSQSHGGEAGKGCGFDRDQAADAVVRYAHGLQAQFAQLRIGEIEPYPRFSAEELGEWIDALRRGGFTPTFFHLDVDRDAVRVRQKDVVKDLRWLNQFLRKRGIPFGVILWSPAKSDQEFYESALGWARTINMAVGKPDQVVFQNWAGGAGVPHDIPANMPKNDPKYSHMRVIDDALTMFKK